MSDVRKTTKQLALDSLARGDATGWFEPLYASAAGEPSRIPWADLAPNPHLVSWAQNAGLRGDGKSALVVGCGLGDDAEWLASRGFHVTAFDLSETAIAWARRRFPSSRVVFEVADLLACPEEWSHEFDFVFEAYTIQSLPEGELRPKAIAAIASTVAENGTLLVIARGRDDGQVVQGPPWPLSPAEATSFAQHGLDEILFEDFLDEETPPQRRFRVEFRG
jgi:SAM-dependent methyltransferase